MKDFGAEDGVRRKGKPYPVESVDRVIAANQVALGYQAAVTFHENCMEPFSGQRRILNSRLESLRIETGALWCGDFPGMLRASVR